MKATPEATRAYTSRHPLPTPSVILGKTGLSASPWGFGSYRVGPKFQNHRDALKLALRSGCNLIDTSSNYTDGGSETLIGEVLQELIESKELKREEVIVVTKTGYIQGKNLAIAREREALGNPFREVVKTSDHLWHCISPEFLEDQITRSLERLKLQTIDFLLLHNPEYFLKDDPRHDEYYRRIRSAFEYLSKEVDRGRIAFFGISSNTFPDPRESPEYTSLETVLEIANELPDPSRFAAIQFPFNIFEPAAVLETNNTGKTVAELAASRKLATLINRPLNAFASQRLVRLADAPVSSTANGDPREAFESALAHAANLESSQSAAIHKATNGEFRWAHVIYKNLDQILDLPTWSDLFHGQIRPRLFPALKSAQSLEPEWTLQYQSAMSELFEATQQLLARQDRVFQLELKNVLTRSAPILADSPTLSRRVLRIYKSFPGIDCILVGMRTPEYVRDILGSEQPFSAEKALDALESVQDFLAPSLR
jgi:aryl-alcohol dehydrogenase-like predicted oxidoreductase